jgi:hypothetical protein
MNNYASLRAHARATAMSVEAKGVSSCWSVAAVCPSAAAALAAWIPTHRSRTSVSPSVDLTTDGIARNTSAARPRPARRSRTRSRNATSSSGDPSQDTQMSTTKDPGWRLGESTRRLTDRHGRTDGTGILPDVAATPDLRRVPTIAASSAMPCLPFSSLSQSSGALGSVRHRQHAFASCRDHPVAPALRATQGWSA